MTRTIRSALSAPIAIAPLVWFRIAFGLIMFGEVIRYFQYGWVERYFVAPTFLFKYHGFEWVRPWPGIGMKLPFAALGFLALCLAAGWCYRTAAALFFLGFTYVFLLEQARYLNHFYLICLYSFLLIFVPAGRAFSIDTLLHPRRRSSSAPAWSLWLLRAQICFVYFFGGIAKLNGDWWQGEPIRMWLARRLHYPVIGPWLTEEWVVWCFTYGGLLFDLGIVPLLLWRRTRWFAFGLAAIFNLTNAWIFQIGIFPWLALGATVILFAPRLPLPGSHGAGSNPGVTPVIRKTTLGLVGAYLGLQILLPLRHWLYPGDVQWTEEGHRFSWRMKLRDKDATLAVYAHDPKSGQTVRVDLPRYVNRLQVDEAAARPDMILQLCHHVASDFRAHGHPKIQIRVRAMASLNGRPKQLLIDPDADLAAEPRTLWPAKWIMPLTTPLGKRAEEKAETAEHPVDNG